MEKSDPETELSEKPVENLVNNDSKEDVEKSENLKLKNFLSESIGHLVPNDWLEIYKLFNNRDGSILLEKKLRGLFKPEDYLGRIENSVAHIVWDTIGNLYRFSQRYYDAKQIYLSEYEEMLKAQLVIGQRIHKGTPLCWLFDVYSELDYHATAKRFIMLTLVEDTIDGSGVVNKDKTGVYFRLNWQVGMSDYEFSNYVAEIWRLAKEHPVEARFPEWILQKLDTQWVNISPSQKELGTYYLNQVYFDFLHNRLGDQSGTTLEILAHYILSCIPGCRASRRKKTPSTDYDVFCVFEGINYDFRALIDKYFVCECKDRKESFDVTAVLKFVSVLKSIDTNFGIIISPKGITGRKTFTAAERELIKTYQRERIIVVVIDKNDLKNIGDGKNFINILREKYERVRFELFENEPLQFSSRRDDHVLKGKFN